MAIQFINGDVYVSDGPAPEPDTRPVRDQIASIITDYDCEWHNPLELADKVIAMVRDSDGTR